MGDGVNIAARLEGIAKPGAICLSEDAYRQVKRQARSGGHRSRPDAAQEHRRAGPGLFAASRRAGRGEARGAKPASRSRRKALGAVLPLVAADRRLLVLVAARRMVFLRAKPRRARRFERTGARPRIFPSWCCPSRTSRSDPAQDYFADGVTDNLTTDLSRIRNSFVIARNTAFTYKGKSIDVKEIGKELGVRYVLEGSVQRDQNRVRVNAQLDRRRNRRTSLGRPLRGRRRRPVQAAGPGSRAAGQQLWVTNSSWRKPKKALVPKVRTLSTSRCAAGLWSGQVNADP